MQWLDISLGNLNLAAGPWFDVRALTLMEVEHWVISTGAAGEPGGWDVLSVASSAKWTRPL